jgi:hypothetical protein
LTDGSFIKTKYVFLQNPIYLTTSNRIIENNLIFWRLPFHPKKRVKLMTHLHSGPESKKCGAFTSTVPYIVSLNFSFI